MMQSLEVLFPLYRMAQNLYGNKIYDLPLNCLDEKIDRILILWNPSSVLDVVVIFIWFTNFNFTVLSLTVKP